MRDISPDILYEDNHLIVVNKRPSDLVQGDKTGDTTLPEMVKAYIKKKYNKPGEVFLGVVHRLDRPVSGAVVFARTSKALSRMNKLIKEGGLHKTYLALTENKPPQNEGHLTDWLLKNQKQNKSYVVEEGRQGAKKAELNYKLIASGKKYHLVEIELITGRHHQIRVQLAHIGCTIKGDLKYGAGRSNPGGSISLHAREISFVHPVKKEKLTVVAPLPAGDVFDKILREG